MNKLLLAMLVAAASIPAIPALAHSDPQDGGYRQDGRGDDGGGFQQDGQNGRQSSGDWRQYRNYDHDRLEPGYSDYDASRYYRDHPSYKNRRLSSNDRVYRGSDNRYYCRRGDGTTGLIVGGLGGGLLGNAIAPRGSGLLGTLLGAGGGALAGRAVDRNRKVNCR